MVSKRRFLQAIQEFSRHYFFFLRRLAELYPSISDEPEFMRLFKIRKGFHEKYNDKVIEAYKGKMADDIARQVIKSIYDKIELKLADIRKEELNLELQSVINDYIVTPKRTLVTEKKNLLNSKEERKTYKSKGRGKAYDSGDGGKAYNFGEERIVIYNLGEERQPKNNEAVRKVTDLAVKRNTILGDKKEANTSEEVTISNNLGDEGKIIFEDEENSNNLGEQGNADSLGEDEKVGNHNATK